MTTAMATGLLIFNTPTTTRSSLTFKPPPLIPATRVSVAGALVRRKMRSSTVVTRAIPSSSYVFAFVFPLSLLAVTIFTSIKIADKLDRDFLEELEVKEAIRLGEEMEEGDDGISVKDEPKPALSRTRNRPKRQA